MEAAAAWIPYDIQLSNWTMEYPGWAPGFHVDRETESTDTFGSWLQTSVSCSSGGHQMVEYAAATQHNPPIVKSAQEFDELHFHNMEMKFNNDPIHTFQDTAHKFKVDMDMMKMKIHMYPSSIQVFDDEWFTVPRMEAIGPHHRARNQLKQAERAKHVAAYQCIMESGHSVQDMYDAVASTAYDASSSGGSRFKNL